MLRGAALRRVAARLGKAESGVEEWTAGLGGGGGAGGVGVCFAAARFLVVVVRVRRGVW